jgi:NADPH-dependent glutamate synthase beta subunit-like oxidoreductase
MSAAMNAATRDGAPMHRTNSDFGSTVQGTPAPCRAACPVGTDAAAYVALLAEGRIADAYDVARQHNPFPSVCGRVCSAPCERSCRRGVIDAAVSIRALKRVLCDAYGAEQGDVSRWMQGVRSIPEITRESVGIIGAGPAGLAAAHDLRLAGHAVTIYEAMEFAGGMMRYGIPAFRLPREIIDAEIAAIVSLGIDLRLSCQIGRDITFNALLQQHAAVLVTIGCQQGRQLRAPGADLPGVVRAVDFLRAENARVEGHATGASVLGDGSVVVIGGGSVAFDAARSAWRASAMTAYDGQTAVDVARSARRAEPSGVVRDVTMIAPEQRASLPVPVEELHEATVEGVTLRDGFGVVRILGETAVTGVEIAPVQRLFDEAGRFAPVLDTERSTVLPARTVVLAIGQQSDSGFLSDTPDVQINGWGGLVVDAELRSTHTRVWAAGDAASGPRDLIDAIAAGQRAARSMVRALHMASGNAPVVATDPQSNDLRAQRRAIEVPRVHTAPALANNTRFWSRYDDVTRAPLPVLQPAARDAATEVEAALAPESARVEASRCLRCDEHMQFSARRCIACALCVDVCPQSSLALLPAGERGLALVFDDQTCIRCGLCVHRCPTDALMFTLAPTDRMPVLADVLDDALPVVAHG